MSKVLSLGVVILIAAASSSGIAAADETGIAGIHPWVRVGGKTCFDGHYHYGSGSGLTQPQARAAAIRAWAWPTDLEYGSSWAGYRLAVAKTMECKRSGALWNCDTQAVPCRRY